MAGEKAKEEMVRVWRWKEEMAGREDSESESESSSSLMDGLEDLMGLDGENLREEEVFCEASKTPKLPSLSPAKTRGFSG